MDEIKTNSIEEYQDCTEHLKNSDQEVKTVAPILSLHALQGFQGHNTMKLVAKIGEVDAIILVDSESTHNFVDSKLVRRLNLPIELTSQMRVMIADGESLSTKEMCKVVECQAQRHRFITDFLVLSIKGCDMVLEV